MAEVVSATKNGELVVRHAPRMIHQQCPLTTLHRNSSSLQNQESGILLVLCAVSPGLLPEIGRHPPVLTARLLFGAMPRLM
jgi:hypothetical protein